MTLFCSCAQLLSLCYVCCLVAVDVLLPIFCLGFIISLILFTIITVVLLTLIKSKKGSCQSRHFIYEYSLSTCWYKRVTPCTETGQRLETIKGIVFLPIKVHAFNLFFYHAFGEAKHSTAWRSTAQHSMAQQGAAVYSTAQNSTAQPKTTQQYIDRWPVSCARMALFCLHGINSHGWYTTSGGSYQNMFKNRSHK